MSYPKTKGGDEMTPEFLDELAREAEGGFEDWNGKMVRVGRPPLSRSGASRRLQVRVAPELGDTLDQIAEDRDMSVSEILRQAIERYVRDVA